MSNPLNNLVFRKVPILVWLDPLPGKTGVEEWGVLDLCVLYSQARSFWSWEFSFHFSRTCVSRGSHLSDRGIKMGRYEAFLLEHKFELSPSFATRRMKGRSTAPALLMGALVFCLFYQTLGNNCCYCLFFWTLPFERSKQEGMWLKGVPPINIFPSA